jgi:trehalose-6-phosphatase
MPQGLLEELQRRCPKGLAVVTGRPRKDCNKFLAAHGWVLWNVLKKVLWRPLEAL